MPVVVSEHHLKDFDQWFALFSANPPPAIGRWQLARGIDDPNRVHVVGEMDASEVDGVKNFFASEKMRAVLAQADEMSTTPIKTIWLEEGQTMTQAPISVEAGFNAVTDHFKLDLREFFTRSNFYLAVQAALLSVSGVRDTPTTILTISSRLCLPRRDWCSASFGD